MESILLKLIKYYYLMVLKLQKLAIFAAFTFICVINATAQSTYGGIEIGSKGVKISIIEVENARKSIYTIKDFWTENVGIAKGISIDGKLAAADIENAANVVNANLIKLQTVHKIPNDKIFIVASSGVGMASNTDALVSRVKSLTNKDMEVIDSKLEAKLSFRGCIPPKFYSSGVLIDIGGGNTKGGYAELINDNLIFFPLNLDLGTITLTEKINKRTDGVTIEKFIDENFKFQKDLKTEVKQMMVQRPLTKAKSNVYLSGGAAWAFYTLFNEGAAANNFNELKIEEVKDYDAKIKNNFSTFMTLAQNNTEVERVLKTYSQKHLISANNLLLASMENFDETTSRKFYFVKNGQIAWLLSYISDSARGSKVMY